MNKLLKCALLHLIFKVEQGGARWSTGTPFAPLLHHPPYRGWSGGAHRACATSKVEHRR